MLFLSAFLGIGVLFVCVRMCLLFCRLVCACGSVLRFMFTDTVSLLYVVLVCCLVVCCVLF